MREVGYPGSSNLLVRYINQGRVEGDRPHLSPRWAARLLLTRPVGLTADQHETFAGITAACTEMTALAGLIRSSQMAMPRMIPLAEPHRRPLHAVIDFGCAAVGDPACDPAMEWTFFTGGSAAAFRRALHLDAATRDRAAAGRCGRRSSPSAWRRADVATRTPQSAGSAGGTARARLSACYRRPRPISRALSRCRTGRGQMPPTWSRGLR